MSLGKADLTSEEVGQRDLGSVAGLRGELHSFLPALKEPYFGSDLTKVAKRAHDQSVWMGAWAAGRVVRVVVEEKVYSPSSRQWHQTVKSPLKSNESLKTTAHERYTD